MSRFYHNSTHLTVFEAPHTEILTHITFQTKQNLKMSSGYTPSGLPFEAPEYRCSTHPLIKDPTCIVCRYNAHQREIGRDEGQRSRAIVDQAIENHAPGQHALYGQRNLEHDVSNDIAARGSAPPATRDNITWTGTIDPRQAFSNPEDIKPCQRRIIRCYSGPWPNSPSSLSFGGIDPTSDGSLGTTDPSQASGSSEDDGFLTPMGINSYGRPRMNYPSYPPFGDTDPTGDGEQRYVGNAIVPLCDLPERGPRNIDGVTGNEQGYRAADAPSEPAQDNGNPGNDTPAVEGSGPLSSAGNNQSQLANDPDNPRLKPRCQRCRQLKKGCDRQRPCKRCKDSGLTADECIPEDASNRLTSGYYGYYSSEGVPFTSGSLKRKRDRNESPANKRGSGNRGHRGGRGRFFGRRTSDN
jgi:hypothetical protein